VRDAFTVALESIVRAGCNAVPAGIGPAPSATASARSDPGTFARAGTVEGPSVDVVDPETVRQRVRWAAAPAAAIWRVELSIGAGVASTIRVAPAGAFCRAAVVCS